MQVALRGAFQNMGQNCAGSERFIVYEKVENIAFDWIDFSIRFMMNLLTSLQRLFEN